MHEVKPLPVDPNDWRCEDVSNWLKKIGMSKYADLIAFKHKVSRLIIQNGSESEQCQNFKAMRRYLEAWSSLRTFLKVITLVYPFQVDGKCLLGLTDTDLKDPPVSINCLGDIKKILFAIGNLNKQVRFYN